MTPGAGSAWHLVEAQDHTEWAQDEKAVERFAVSKLFIAQ